MASMGTTREAVTAASKATDTGTKAAQDSSATTPNLLRFTEYGAVATALDSQGCDPYNSSQGKPLHEAWKRRSDRR
jgi:hypothetical protein